MPIYEYQCRECGEVMEEYFHLSDSDSAKAVDCSKCGAKAKKIISRLGAAITENPAWMSPFDPRHPDSPNRNLVNKRSAAEMANLPKTRSEREALMQKKGLSCEGDSVAGSDMGVNFSPQGVNAR